MAHTLTSPSDYDRAYPQGMAFVLARGVDEENYLLLDDQYQDSGWRVQYERSVNSWSASHADSNALSEVALSLGYFSTPQAAAMAVERIAP